MKDYKARIHVALEHALMEATLQAESASMELNAIIGAIPSGLPTPELVPDFPGTFEFRLTTKVVQAFWRPLLWPTLLSFFR